MLTITNISITQRAYDLLRDQRARFRPRDPGDVFGLAYTSSLTDAHGTTPPGFRPGYTRDSFSLSVMKSADWAAFVPVTGGLDFYFMPRFKWSAAEHYVIDLSSERHGLLSIGPAELAKPGRSLDAL